MKGRIKMPDDLDTMCQAEIEEMFSGSPIEPGAGNAEPTSPEPRRKP